jgi:hypothetical protein
MCVLAATAVAARPHQKQRLVGAAVHGEKIERRNLLK